MSNFDCFDFGLALPGHRRRHLEPPDDHYQSMSARAERHRSDTDQPDRDARPTDETLNYDFSPLFAMKMTQSAFRAIIDYFSSREPEAAGLLLGPVEDDLLVTHFLPDEQGDGTAVSFRLSAAALNRNLKRVKPAGLDGKGLVHSHPANILQPSAGDLAYVRQLFGLPANTDAQQCFLPIVCGRRIYPYVYARGRVWLAELILV